MEAPVEELVARLPPSLWVLLALEEGGGGWRWVGGRWKVGGIEVEGGLKVSVAQQHFHIPGLPATSTPARQMPGAPQ